MSNTLPRGNPEWRSVGRRPAHRVLLVGPPGSGKSTQGTLLAERLGAAYVSTGALLREEVRRGSPIGRQAETDMNAGRLVPDWLIMLALERSLSDAMRSSFVLDGYPRTLEQAKTFTRSLGRARLDRVIELVVPDDLVIVRLARRLRGDDDDRVVRTRLRIYRQETNPMLDFFATAGLLEKVDGTRLPEIVASDVVGVFDRAPVVAGTARTTVGREGTIDSPGSTVGTRW